MDLLNALILLLAGVAGGFIAGLVGVGGGIIFAPVLFFFFESTGLAHAFLAPMTIGTSLLCTLTASGMSARQHHLHAAVDWGVAVRVGVMSAAALYLVVAFVTTQAWYDRFAFQAVFGVLLLAVAAGMFRRDRSDGDESLAAVATPRSYSLTALSGIASAAGAIAALAGVGGGIIMVPAYHQFLKLSMRTSVGTSSAAIVIISAIGVLGYAVSGWSHVQGFSTLGYVDVAHGLVLALPAVPGARAGAALAHRLPRRVLRMSFAALAVVVAVRMIVTAASRF